jgi:ankyrin repeat protein
VPLSIMLLFLSSCAGIPASDLTNAAWRGDVSAVQALLAKGADVNMKAAGGMTALMSAAHEGRFAVVQALLAKGADVNASRDDGVTALMLASLPGFLDVVQALLASGADVNAKSNIGLTPLEMAVSSPTGHLEREVVQALLDKGADANASRNDGITALMIAAQDGKLGSVQALLAKGADVNAKERNQGGTTALMMAAQKGRVDVVQALLAKGADVNARTNSGRTSLMFASNNNYPEVVRILLANGAGTTQKTPQIPPSQSKDSGNQKALPENLATKFVPMPSNINCILRQVGMAFGSGPIVSLTCGVTGGVQKSINSASDVLKNDGIIVTQDFGEFHIANFAGVDIRTAMTSGAPYMTSAAGLSIAIANDQLKPLIGYLQK